MGMLSNTTAPALILPEVFRPWVQTTISGSPLPPMGRITMVDTSIGLLNFSWDDPQRTLGQCRGSPGRWPLRCKTRPIKFQNCVRKLESPHSVSNRQAPKGRPSCRWPWNFPTSGLGCSGSDLGKLQVIHRNCQQA